jgi:hypothetical protein
MELVYSIIIAVILSLTALFAAILLLKDSFAAMYCDVLSSIHALVIAMNVCKKQVLESINVIHGSDNVMLNITKVEEEPFWLREVPSSTAKFDRDQDHSLRARRGARTSFIRLKAFVFRETRVKVMRTRERYAAWEQHVTCSFSASPFEAECCKSSFDHLKSLARCRRNPPLQVRPESRWS